MQWRAAIPRCNCCLEIAFRLVEYYVPPSIPVHHAASQRHVASAATGIISILVERLADIEHDGVLLQDWPTTALLEARGHTYDQEYGGNTRHNYSYNRTKTDTHATATTLLLLLLLVLLLVGYGSGLGEDGEAIVRVVVSRLLLSGKRGCRSVRGAFGLVVEQIAVKTLA